MTWYPIRVLPPVGIISGLVVACALGGGTTQSEVTPNPAPPPRASPNTVTPDEIARVPAVTLEQLLAGRIAGVSVRKTAGGGLSVRIHGASSFLLSSEPLYVVDGVVVEPAADGAMSWLNPNDVESIEVLKDPPSTAIYGVRGANGVILIRTKGSH